MNKTTAFKQITINDFFREYVYKITATETGFSVARRAYQRRHKTGSYDPEYWAKHNLEVFADVNNAGTLEENIDLGRQMAFYAQQSMSMERLAILQMKSLVATL